MAADATYHLRLQSIFEYGCGSEAIIEGSGKNLVISLLLSNLFFYMILK
jgi:hypothetical protein